jgi:hypothetical protein
MIKKIFLIVTLTIASHYARAIIIIPIPNLAFPDVIGKTRDALEKSTDTKALATVGEDKLFGSRQWTWGQVSGKMTQADADAQAMSKCEANLRSLKAQTVGGKTLYNFGDKKCELYKFQNATLNLPEPVLVTPAPVVATPVIKQDEPLTASPTVKENQTPSNTNAIKSGTATMQKLQDLESLLKQGLIDQDDYNRKKKQFLDEM